MIALLNGVLALVGVIGSGWCIYTAFKAWPVTVYFFNLLVVGLVSVLMYRHMSYFMTLLAIVSNCVSIVILMMLLITGFLLSPASGVASLPFLGIPLFINLLSLRWIRTART